MSDLELFDYQVEGIKILREKKKMILADDMGLGKTAEALFSVWEEGRVRVLIVCNATAISVWRDEIRKWLPPETTISIVSQGDADEQESAIRAGAQFTIINYERIIARVSGGYVNNQRLKLLSSIPWTSIIFDEAHRLKNRKSKTLKAAKSIIRATSPKRLIPITATPILNRPEELWPLLNLIDPDNHKSFWNWVQRYCMIKTSYWGYGKAMEIGELIEPGRLKTDVSRYILRRVKKDVWKNMPEKTYQIVNVELEGTQARMYKEMLEGMSIELGEGKSLDAVNVMTQMTRLKQISVSHSLISSTEEELEGAKISALKEIVEGLGDQKAVIFSQYAKVIERLNLPNMVKFTGSYNTYEREYAIKKFQNDTETRLIATTIQCGGQSITLTAGTVVIFLDLLWTPKLNAQAVDRVHRRGQNLPVTIIILNAVNTVEDYINHVLQRKEELFEAVIPETTVVSMLKEYYKQALLDAS